MGDDVLTATCPDCGGTGEADEHADEDFVSYQCQDCGQFFMKRV